jgi:hypothetical protein
MTTFSFNLHLNESEVIMLEAALQLMIESCEKNIAEGGEAPNLSHKYSAKDVLSRLYKNMEQSSGNNF